MAAYYVFVTFRPYLKSHNLLYTPCATQCVVYTAHWSSDATAQTEASDVTTVTSALHCGICNMMKGRLVFFTQAHYLNVFYFI